jgi:hypothetical protein
VYREAATILSDEMEADVDENLGQSAAPPQPRAETPGEMERQTLAGQSRRDAEGKVEESLRTGTEQDLHKKAKPDVPDGLETFADDPQKWVDRLLELKETRQIEQLEQELEVFRSIYPDYELPSELLD